MKHNFGFSGLVSICCEVHFFSIHNLHFGFRNSKYLLLQMRFSCSRLSRYNCVKDIWWHSVWLIGSVLSFRNLCVCVCVWQREKGRQMNLKQVSACSIKCDWLAVPVPCLCNQDNWKPMSGGQTINGNINHMTHISFNQKTHFGQICFAFFNFNIELLVFLSDCRGFIIEPKTYYNVTFLDSKNMTVFFTA